MYSPDGVLRRHTQTGTWVGEHTSSSSSCAKNLPSSTIGATALSTEVHTLLWSFLDIISNTSPRLRSSLLPNHTYTLYRMYKASMRSVVDKRYGRGVMSYMLAAFHLRKIENYQDSEYTRAVR